MQTCLNGCKDQSKAEALHKSLTVGTKKAAAAYDFFSFNQSTAIGARVSFLLEDIQVILVFPLLSQTVQIITEAGAPPLDAVI